MEKIISFSIRNKLIVILFTLTIASFGLYSIFKIPVGAVPDITNNNHIWQLINPRNRAIHNCTSRNGNGKPT